MRQVYIILSFFLIISELAMSQQRYDNEIKTDSRDFNCISSFQEIKNEIPVLQIDSCILNYLGKVFLRDTICNYYRKSFTAYNFSITNQTGFYAIEIRPLYLDHLHQTDYFGAFKLRDRFFYVGDVNRIIYSKNQKVIHS
jgi:hypothetical protein